jgi:hypothetical protein
MRVFKVDNLKTPTILNNMKVVLSRVTDEVRIPLSSFLDTIFEQQQHYDAICVFGASAPAIDEKLRAMLPAYRRSINENVLYVNVDVSQG